MMMMMMMSLTATLGFVSLITLVGSMESPCCSCTAGLPGIPGISGKDGRDGRRGPKGEAGPPASSLPRSLRGDKGEPGPRGPLGKNGPKGPTGLEGEKGEQGEVGATGSPGDHKRQYQSAFTVARLTQEHPLKNTPILFTKQITNDHQDYNVTSGKFQCRIPGHYFFSFHSSHSANLCAALYVDGKATSSFCDHMSSKSQVASGGVLVSLAGGQEVWMEVNDYNGMIGTEGNDSVFSGFLVSPQ
ncbi:complement C1q subcomponent subunit C [Xenopus laevis]|uniref:Complement C1q subcomponent subunit C n=1 Tax=Xenopus laevis TaxID=8355 RepID=A0A8J0U627_XENLA|nr:complement C1q subcomponent subunit C [Xenopus laevis]